MAERLHKFPEEVEEMDYSWYVDIQLFLNAETAAEKAKRKK